MAQSHEERALSALRSAVMGVPFYVRQKRPVPAEETALADALAAQPLLTRGEIRASLPKAWLPEGRDLTSVTVLDNGVGDARIRLLVDPSWAREDERGALALHPRSNGATRLAVLSVPERGSGSCGAGDPEYEERLEGHRLHLNSRQDPTFWSELVMTRMLDELLRHETQGLLADPFYLDFLARHARTLGRRLDARGFVATSRALATHAQRKMLAAVYGGPVLDILGSRATGTMFVSGEDGLLHHAPFATHVELLRAKVPTPGADDVALVVATTLGRAVMPLVRFITGDLVSVAAAPPGPTTVPPISAALGNVDDAVLLPNGALVTPAAVDRSLAEFDLRGYQLTQTASDSAELEVIGGAPESARDALASLLLGIRIHARVATALAVESNGKYRSVRRRFRGPPLTDLFHGVA